MTECLFSPDELRRLFARPDECWEADRKSIVDNGVYHIFRVEITRYSQPERPRTRVYRKARCRVRWKRWRNSQPNVRVSFYRLIGNHPAIVAVKEPLVFRTLAGATLAARQLTGVAA